MNDIIRSLTNDDDEFLRLAAISTGFTEDEQATCAAFHDRCKVAITRLREVQALGAQRYNELHAAPESPISADDYALLVKRATRLCRSQYFKLPEDLIRIELDMRKSALGLVRVNRKKHEHAADVALQVIVDATRAAGRFEEWQKLMEPEQ